MSSSFQLKSHPSRLLRDHLLGVAEKSTRLIDELLQACGQLQLSAPLLRSMAHVIGVAHDVGKATRYFQDYLAPKKIRPRDSTLKAHSMFSALYGYFAARKLFQGSEYSTLVPSYVSLVIQGHHGALESPTITAAKSLERRHTIADQILAIERRDEIDLILQDAGLPAFSEFEPQANSEILNRLRAQAVAGREIVKLFGKNLTPFFLVNILFSVLIDADRMDAAGLSFPERREIASATVAAYVTQLSSESRLCKNASQTVVDGRDELFRMLSKKAMQIPLNRRIFSVTAPTGYGKTLAGLQFALKLRERFARNGFSPKIIYVAPYLSILDQNFERIAEALGVSPTQSNVLLLHHHLAEMQYETPDLSRETFSALDSELLIEGWNAEIIVTSFIQFFYAVVGSKSSQLRKLHNLVGSVVILDEVQTIPHEYWALVRETLQFMTDKLRMYVVLMTATQPLIFSKDETMELARDLPSESWAPRVTIKSNIDKDVSLEEFVKEANRLVKASQDKSILIVMNTIHTALKVFDGLKTRMKRYYLSANVVPAHRKERIVKIAEGLERREPLLLVSTQVVEAGVDLDFDMVIRDIGPVDSIIQVAGRCNRNGLRESRGSEVHVYSVVDSGTRARYGNRIYGNYLIDKSRDVLRASHGLDPFHLAQEYYLAVQTGSTDRKSQDLLRAMGELDYKKLQEEFKLIDDQPSFSVYVEVDEKASQIWDRYVRVWESERGGFERKEEFLKIRQDFYNYVINVSARETSGLVQSKGFYRISRNEIGVLYDEETGFTPAIWPKTQKPREAYIY